MTKNKLWFRAKKFGWGWYPVTWQGWAVTLLYVVLMTAVVAIIGDGFESRAGGTTFLFLGFILTTVLLWICYQKGEPPKWRWGK